MKQNIPAFLAALLGILLIILGNWSIGSVPPLGQILSPSTGFLQNRESKIDLQNQILPDGLTKDSCTVIMDSLLVPHIYAQNDLDAYRVQGYLQAKYRLWQMDFITRVASGRISEIVGPQALEFDVKQRRKGLAKSARETEEAWKNYPISYEYLEAFAHGANTYIESLTKSSLPIEFKLMNYEPESWSPYKSALFFKHMSAVLCFRQNDFELTNAKALLAPEVFDLLYPERIKGSPPVIPGAGPVKKLTIDTISSAPPIDIKDIQLYERPVERTDDGLGSNNWAVSPGKSSSGHTLLANDPHLPLTFPSVWYMLHIHTPNQNAMGVAFPGIPGVIIGFNDKIAWGVTNVGQDVLDWLEVDWNPNNSTYRWGEETKRVEWVIEKIKVKGQDEVLDSVAWTEYGPIWSVDEVEGNKSVILRWLAHTPPKSDEMSVFPGINRAQNYEEWKSAVSKYNSPPQNFIFASNSGDIALRVQGRFPNRKSRYGRTIEKASDQKTWDSYIPTNEVPQSLNPEQGFLASANQVSTDHSYPYYYINADFRPSRARTINNFLNGKNQLTVADMRSLQNDNYDIESHHLIKASLPYLDASSPAITILNSWDGIFSKDCEECPLVELYKSKLGPAIYDELKTDPKYTTEYPSNWITVELLQDSLPNSIFDITSTPEVESKSDIVSSAFEQANADYSELKDKRWYKFRDSYIPHVIPAFKSFGADSLPCGGTGTAPNALRQTKGPSWRFIVEMSDQPKALGVYPGGQSGHPGSSYFDNLLDHWIKGEYYNIEAPADPQNISNSLFTLRTAKNE